MNLHDVKTTADARFLLSELILRIHREKLFTRPVAQVAMELECIITSLLLDEKPVCKVCGTVLLCDCPRCGAPNCCPMCCERAIRIQTDKNNSCAAAGPC